MKKCRGIASFLRKSRRIVAFLMLSSLKNEVTQTCCVFDVVKFDYEEVTQNCCVF